MSQLNVDGQGRLQGKVALITGGATGIGAATARRFVAEGANVVIMDIDSEAGEALAAQLSGQAVFVRGDHCVALDNEQAVQVAVEHYKKLHVLFNNAGIASRQPFAELSDQALERVMNVNVLGPFRMTRAALPTILSSAAEGKSSILFTGSVQSLIVRANFAAYGSTKHAISGLVGSLALELAESGIRVNGLCPGPVDTTVFRESMAGSGGDLAKTAAAHIAGVPMKRMITADEVASAAVFLASDEASAITGVMLPVDGGITAR